jgi:hypothetical protein
MLSSSLTLDAWMLSSSATSPRGRPCSSPGSSSPSPGGRPRRGIARPRERLTSATPPGRAVVRGSAGGSGCHWSTSRSTSSSASRASRAPTNPSSDRRAETSAASSSARRAASSTLCGLAFTCAAVVRSGAAGPAPRRSTGAMRRACARRRSPAPRRPAGGAPAAAPRPRRRAPHASQPLAAAAVSRAARRKSPSPPFSSFSPRAARARGQRTAPSCWPSSPNWIWSSPAMNADPLCFCYAALEPRMPRHCCCAAAAAAAVLLLLWCCDKADTQLAPR